MFAARGPAGDEAVDRTGRTLHAEHVRAPGTVPPELAAAAIGVLADRGRAEDHAVFVERFETADTPQEQIRYLYALADFADPALFAATLDLVAGERVRSQNAPYVLRRALTNRDRGADAWAFVTTNWDLLGERFPSNSIARMLEGVRALDRPDLAERVAALRRPSTRCRRARRSSSSTASGCGSTSPSESARPSRLAAHLT